MADKDSPIIKKTIKIARLLKAQSGSKRRHLKTMQARVYKEGDNLQQKIAETLRLLKKSQ